MDCDQFLPSGACSLDEEAEGQRIITVQGGECNVNVVHEVWTRQGEGQDSWGCHPCTLHPESVPIVYSPEGKCKEQILS